MKRDRRGELDSRSGLDCGRDRNSEAAVLRFQAELPRPAHMIRGKHEKTDDIFTDLYIEVMK